MLNCKELLKIRDENESREPSQARDTIAALLKHIQDVHEQTHLRYRVAYEVFYMGRGTAYGRREIKGYAWTRKDADTIAQGRYHVSVIHVIKIDGKWHRVSALPIEIQGQAAEAKLSRIDPNYEEHLNEQQTGN